MRFVVVSLLAVFSGLSFAHAASKTVLHVPLFVEFSSGPSHRPNYEFVAVAKVNPLLVQKGQPAQLEFVDLTVDTDFDAYKFRNQLNDALIAAGLEDSQAHGEYYPANWGDDVNYTCYRGDGNSVIDIVLNNTDRMYSDQYTLIAWRLGKKTVLAEDLDDSAETAQFLNESSPFWKNYDKKSDSVVILASIGDGGDDVQESLIPHCK